MIRLGAFGQRCGAVDDGHATLRESQVELYVLLVASVSNGIERVGLGTENPVSQIDFSDKGFSGCQAKAGVFPAV